MKLYLVTNPFELKDKDDSFLPLSPEKLGQPAFYAEDKDKKPYHIAFASLEDAEQAAIEFNVRLDEQSHGRRKAAVLIVDYSGSELAKVNYEIGTGKNAKVLKAFQLPVGEGDVMEASLKHIDKEKFKDNTVLTKLPVPVGPVVAIEPGNSPRPKRPKKNQSSLPIQVGIYAGATGLLSLILSKTPMVGFLSGVGLAGTGLAVGVVASAAVGVAAIAGTLKGISVLQESLKARQKRQTAEQQLKADEVLARKLQEEEAAKAKPAKPAEPATKPAEPATKPAEPAAKPAEPATKPAEPAAKPAEPAAKPAEPAAKPAEPAAKTLLVAKSLKDKRMARLQKQLGFGVAFEEEARENKAKRLAK